MGFDLESLLLAKAGGSGGASSWNDLTDRPFYAEGGEGGPLDIRWDGVIGENHYIAFSDTQGFYKVSDLVLTADQLIGATLVVFDGSSGEEETITLTTDLVQDMSSQGVSAIIAGNGCYCFSEAGTVNEMSFEAGVYFFHAQDEGDAAATYVKSLSNPNVVVGDPEVVHTIDPKYIKDMYYEDVCETFMPLNIEWDGVVGDKYHVEQNGYIIYKVSDVVLTAEQISGATCVMQVGAKESSGVVSNDLIVDGATAGFSGVYAGDGAVISLSAPSTIEALGGLTLAEPGTYFNWLGSTLYTKSLSNPDATMTVVSKRVVFPIDEKYLPTTVPVIQSATVGQTIVVKAVDDTGKPTEWAAVDGVVNGDTELRLTSAGGKVFSVTVDDTGALTAAEVTA